VKFISTRGQAPALSFEDVVLTGLANDGGLYVPESIPQFSLEEIAAMRGLPYNELAFKIMSPFIGDELRDSELKDIIDRSYASFRHRAIAPLVQIGHNEWILELFQGPTLAFKDFALQFLGNLLDFILSKRQQKVVVMGATSGDTGSAAIEGCRHCKNVDIFILHPNKRVSEVQRRQMTTVIADNVHNIALEGNFDDCQNMVKASFADQTFIPDGRQLVAVNSINWARIMAQIVYYFYSALALGSPDRPVSFAVPTGNFGDIFAGYLASRMGLPIEQLVIATNQNDILHRCLSANDHSKKALEHSLSPSMDIMVSSNFERMLFDLYDRDGNAIAELMMKFKSGAMTLSDEALRRARQLFSSYRLGDEQVLGVIKNTYEQSAYLLDPHTAIGVEAARKTRRNVNVPMICFATAHPAKFPDAIQQAGCQDPALPSHMQDLFQREERYQLLANDIVKVHEFMRKTIRL
jgi:threonine synthase